MKGVHTKWAAVAAAVAVLALSGGVSPAVAADKERGRILYENHCMVCHTPKVHSRPNRIPLSLDELRQIVSNWAKEENLPWSNEEINDVVWYLNTTRYRFTK